MKYEIKALHWLRSKQEENELGYWLSFAAYDQKDRSWVNKAYLLYLVIFLFIWLMMMLFFFAKYGGMALALINPDQSANTVVALEWVVLAAWNLLGLIQSARRSPIVFSETDKSIVCQTPVNRRTLVARWLWMPWIKSALPFWLMALVLGFSTAELHFASADAANVFFSYVSFGLRALIQVIPIHLSFYTLQWIVGVIRLRKNIHADWVIYPAIALGLIPFVLLLLNQSFSKILGSSPLILFLDPNYINGTTSSPLVFGICTALLFLGLLFWVSLRFNLNRAAQETSEIELTTTASRYGFTDLVEQHRLQNRLSSKRKISRSIKYSGSAVMIWKNQLQTFRGWNWKQIFPLVTVFSITLGFPLIPGFLGKLLALFFLVMQIGPQLTPRLRSDLACWPILQQLPFHKPKVLIYDLFSTLPLLFAVSLLGLLVSAIISHAFAFNFLLILPGLLATIGCTAAIDIFRKSKSDLLINGNVPSVGTQGVILGLIGTVLPIGLQTALPTLAGTVISVAISLVISWICFKFAVYSFIHIKSG